GCSGQALGFSFSFERFDTEFNGVLNTTITMGAAWRMEERSEHLVGKSNNNPNLCGRAPDGGILYQSCQGLFRDQTFVADRLVSGVGQFTTNADDGNLNYDKGDMTQSPFKITQDLTLSWGDFGIFARALFFHDFTNNDFREYHPNRITRENLDDVGVVSTFGDELLLPGLPINLPVNLSTVPLFTARTDSRPCPPERNPSGGPCGIVYGPGGVVRNKRSDNETLRQIGEDLELLDLNFFGFLPMPWLGDRELSFKIGRQTISWGESTLLFFDSLNQANPINANHFFRVGMQLEEVFTPLNMISLGTGLTESTSISVFYQLEWEPLVAPAPGSYLSPVDIGTNNAINTLNLGFGSTAEDPDRVASLLDNPLSGLTNTSGAAQRLPDREPDDSGQFGISLKHYAEWLNDGTEIALYYMNYHSRLPYLSTVSVPEGCAKNATNTAEFLLACPNTPLIHSALSPNDPQGATSDAVNFDKIGILLEYPEDIQMWGLSFNTVFGDLAVQGEIAYRPDTPLQVDAEDLALAAFGPAASNCHLPETGCPGSTPGVGVYPDGSTGLYQPSNYVTDANGTPGAFTDTYDLVVGHMAGAGRFFPNFIIPYRGGTLGLNPGSSYIRGWEEFDTYQFNLGGTYIMGSTHPVSSFIKSDQIILLMEAGATWVPDIPDLDVLQLEAPGTFLHASAGADGSGADRSRQACSTNMACSFGPDGLRFNPHQEDLDLFPDEWSYGVAAIAAIRYESVLPGISLQPIIVYKQDLRGTSPGLASNFIQGRKLGDVSLEVRYKSNLSFNFGYSFFAGGGKAHLQRDRDNARFFVKYQF
ncbi:MAG: DUF1302 domain-containing protein, partial [Nevskiales bacterium]